MASKKMLQDSFLSELQQGEVSVSIFLINGIKLHGVIDSFDDQIIMLKSAITQMVYKHAISTVVPARMMTISSGD